MQPTADLCDQHGDRVAVAAPIFRAYGARARFAGTVATLECFEDNSLVRAMLEEPGAGRVLVVDGRGSLRCALVGGNLAVLAHRHGWSGIVVHGCVRDAAELRQVDVGILALATNPRRSEKRGTGQRDVAIAFAGVTFRPGAWVCADEDGLVLAAAAPRARPAERGRSIIGRNRFPSAGSAWRTPGCQPRVCCHGSSQGVV